MKEEKSCPYVRLGSNTPNSNCPRLNRNMAGIIPMNRKTEIGFGLPSAAVLLNWMMAVIGSPILLPTEQSVINT